MAIMCNISKYIHTIIRNIHIHTIYQQYAIQIHDILRLRL